MYSTEIFIFPAGGEWPTTLYYYGKTMGKFAQIRADFLTELLSGYMIWTPKFSPYVFFYINFSVIMT